ncbi:MAG: hypothetical protein AAFY19_00395 [Pseudomonadota bacterium]
MDIFVPIEIPQRDPTGLDFILEQYRDDAERRAEASAVLAAAVPWSWGFFSGAVSYTLESLSRGASQSLSGRALVNGTSVQRWRVRLPMNNVAPEFLSQVRATIIAARGQQRRIQLPVRDFYLPDTIDGPLPGKTRFSFRRGITFSNGAKFCQSGPTSTMTVSQGDTSFLPNLSAIPFMTPGVFFGVGPDVYQVRQRSTAEDPDRVYFEPAARRNYQSAKTTFRPSMLVRFADDTPGAIELDEGRWGRPSLTFVEDPLP